MRLKSLAQILTAFALAIGTVFRVSQPSYAEPTTFFCGTYEGVPATMVHSSRRIIPIIIWVTHYFSNSAWTPQKRCIEVTRRFQTYYNNGTLNYLTTGTINGRPVVCVAETQGSHCTGLLFTLRPGSDPTIILQRMLGIRDENSGSWDESFSRINAVGIHINMTDYLNRRLAELEEYEPSCPAVLWGPCSN